MATFEEGRHPNEMILSEANGNRSRTTGVLTSGSVANPGDQLKLVGGKYVPIVATETGVAVAIYKADATNADAPIVVFDADGELKEFAVNLLGTTTQKNAQRTALNGLGIKLR